VVWRGRALAYGELNLRANRLAHRLRRAGVGPDDRVALLLRRSEWTMIAIFAALKADAAFTPILPDYPEARIRFILEKSGCSAVLTEPGLWREDYPLQADRVFDVTGAADPEPGPDDANPPARALPQNLAYLLFTSGSTGEPKGVLIDRRAARNFVHAIHREAYAPHGECLSLALLAEYVFDASLQQLLIGPAFGHTVYPVDAETKSDGGRLYEFLRDHLIHIADGTPSLLALLTAAMAEREPLPELKCLLIGGEDLPKQGLDAFFATPGGSGVTVSNVYGPSECCVEMIVYHARADRAIAAQTTPIGKPTANTPVHVLDRRLQPVPIGVVGEIYLGEPHVGRGYLADPARTALSFLPDPFGEGARLFRSGDAGRWLADGNLECLGRLDGQVKIRGYRVELGEVERALLRHPAIVEAAVTLHRDQGESALAAYAVCREAPTPEALRAFLAGLLPDYMIPSYFVRLDAMPLTENGKLDRRALPAPERERLLLGADYVAPRDPLERAVAAVWREILGAPRVGAFDNFFDLGGHSIKAAQTAARLASELNAALTLRDVFQAPTPAELAALVRARGGATARAIPPAPAAEHYPLSPEQFQLWTLDQAVGGTAAYNMTGARLFTGQLDPAAMRRAFETLVARHASLRTVFRAVDGAPRQFVAPELTDLFSEEDHSDAADAETALRERLREAAAQPFDLARGPLIAAILLRLPPAGDRARWGLVLGLHHIIGDGWSMEILTREVLACYEAYHAGREPDLAPLPIQHPDYAVWRAAAAAGDAWDDHRAYWRAKLADPPAPLDLRTDLPRPATPDFRGAKHRFHLPPETAAALRRRAREAGASEYMALLALVKTLLYCRAGQSDIVTGVEIAGRDLPELADQIGFFLNLLPLRDRLDPDAPFSAALASVKTTALEAFGRGEYPFHQLIADIDPPREPGHAPLFDVLVSLDDTARDDARAALSRFREEIEDVPLEFDSGTAKYDLTFSFRREGEGFRAFIEYRLDLFKAETVAAMADQLTALAETALARPELTLRQLGETLLGEAQRAERQALLNAATAEISDDF